MALPPYVFTQKAKYRNTLFTFSIRAIANTPSGPGRITRFLYITRNDTTVILNEEESHVK